MCDTSLQIDRGGEAVTTDVKEEATEIADEQEEKSFFARGALLGLFGGALAAILLISIGGSVVSLFEDVTGSGEEAAAPADDLTGEDLLIATGSNLATTNGCIGCHSTNGLDGTGPTWQGLAATVDDEYLRRAIIDPNVEIAAGFDPDVMPATYADSLSDEDVDALIAYIKSL